MILAGDVGGTKTNLGLFRLKAGRLESLREESFSSHAFPSLERMVERFLSRGPRRVGGAAFGVAGPVVRGRSHVVNLRWPVDGRRLARALGLPRVEVLNDLEAGGWGIPELPARQLLSLTPGLRAGAGNAALIAAGTGLGMAILFRDGERLQPSASEGGHQGFAPRDELEAALLAHMRRDLGRVSTERVVAGPGFSAIYRFLVERGPRRESRALRERLAASADPNATISQAGLAGEDPIARRTLELFVSLYGSAAGDLALVAKATGGVYVGGGIAPRILPALRTGEFVRAFRDKGRLSPLLARIPIKVVLEPRAALIGAAACAARCDPRRTRRVSASARASNPRSR